MAIKNTFPSSLTGRVTRHDEPGRKGNERETLRARLGLQSSEQTSFQSGGLSSKQHDDLVLRTDTRLSEKTWLSPEMAAVKHLCSDRIYVYCIRNHIYRDDGVWAIWSQRRRPSGYTTAVCILTFKYLVRSEVKEGRGERFIKDYVRLKVVSSSK